LAEETKKLTINEYSNNSKQWTLVKQPASLRQNGGVMDRSEVQRQQNEE
jgi:hypothetical protein